MNMRKLPRDFAVDPKAAELVQMSITANRLASTLAHLARDPAVVGALRTERPTSKGDNQAIDVEVVREAIQTRRARDQFFEADLFADPAWDMLLDLFEAEISQQRVSVSSLCNASAVPATTALRWIKRLTETGLFQRRADPTDARRIFIELSPKASLSMRAYFAELARQD